MTSKEPLSHEHYSFGDASHGKIEDRVKNDNNVDEIKCLLKKLDENFKLISSQEINILDDNHENVTQMRSNDISYDDPLFDMSFENVYFCICDCKYCRKEDFIEDEKAGSDSKCTCTVPSQISVNVETGQYVRCSIFSDVPSEVNSLNDKEAKTISSTSICNTTNIDETAEQLTSPGLLDGSLERKVSVDCISYNCIHKKKGLIDSLGPDDSMPLLWCDKGHRLLVKKGWGANVDAFLCDLEERKLNQDEKGSRMCVASETAEVISNLDKDVDTKLQFNNAKKARIAALEEHDSNALVTEKTVVPNDNQPEKSDKMKINTYYSSNIFDNAVASIAMVHKNQRKREIKLKRLQTKTRSSSKVESNNSENCNRLQETEGSSNQNKSKSSSRSGKASRIVINSDGVGKLVNSKNFSEVAETSSVAIKEEVKSSNYGNVEYSSKTVLPSQKAFLTKSMKYEFSGNTRAIKSEPSNSGIKMQTFGRKSYALNKVFSEPVEEFPSILTLMRRVNSNENDEISILSRHKRRRDLIKRRNKAYTLESKKITFEENSEFYYQWVHRSLVFLDKLDASEGSTTSEQTENMDPSASKNVSESICDQYYFFTEKVANSDQDLETVANSNQDLKTTPVKQTVDMNRNKYSLRNSKVDNFSIDVLNSCIVTPDQFANRIKYISKNNLKDYDEEFFKVSQSFWLKKEIVKSEKYPTSHENQKYTKFSCGQLKKPKTEIICNDKIENRIKKEFEDKIIKKECEDSASSGSVINKRLISDAELIRYCRERKSFVLLKDIMKDDKYTITDGTANVSEANDEASEFPFMGEFEKFIGSKSANITVKAEPSDQTNAPLRAKRTAAIKSRCLLGDLLDQVSDDGDSDFAADAKSDSDCSDGYVENPNFRKRKRVRFIPPTGKYKMNAVELHRMNNAVQMQKFNYSSKFPKSESMFHDYNRLSKKL